MNRNPKYDRSRRGQWLRRQLAKRPLPVWVLAAADALALILCLLVFALFHHVLPRLETSTGIQSSRYEQEAADLPDDDLPDLVRIGAQGEALDGESPLSDGADGGYIEEAAEEAPTATEPPADADDPGALMPLSDALQGQTRTGYFGDRFPDKFTDGKVIKSDNHYRSANVNITVDQFEYDESTLYFADIYIRDIECFRTAFAKDTFGRSIQELPADIGTRYGSLVTINGDYYGARADGVVIRNGELFRDKNITSDVCVLYWDGTMETYSRRQFDAQEAMANGAYQAWHFGPDLLDDEGKALKRFSDGSLGPRNPRTVLGYYEPGHYCFVVVDGRSDTSDGLTIKVLAQVMQKLGCKRAYNLDGGNSSFMVLGTRTINHPSNGGRPSSDAIMIVGG